MKNSFSYLILVTLLLSSAGNFGVHAQSSLDLSVHGNVIDNYANLTYSLTVPAQRLNFDIDLPRRSGLFLSNATLSNSNITLWGRVTEAKEAEQIYNETVSENAIGMLIVPQGSSFIISINNPADEPLEVSLFVEGMLTRALGSYSLPIIPSTSINYNLDMELDILSTKSSVLAVKVEGLAGQTLTQIEDGFHLSVQDAFITNQVSLTYVLTDYDLGATIVSYSDGETGFFNFFLAPKVETESGTSTRQIIFTIDVSGSMTGNRLDQAKIALSEIIDSLGPSDQFNVVPFSSEATTMWAEVRAATQENKEEAIDYVSNLAALSSTNIYDAITQSLDQFYESDAEKMMLLISDGQPTAGITDPDAIRAHARESNTLGVNISTVAIGNSGVESLLEGIALDNNGVFISIQDNEEIGDALVSLFSSITVPEISQISFSFSSGVVLESLNINLTAGFQGLSNGSEIVVSGKFIGSSVTITANYRIENETFQVSKTASIAAGGDPYAEKMWALQRINYLVGLNIITNSEEFKPQIVSLGIKYGLLIPGYTSMILSQLIEEDNTMTETASSAFGQPNEVLATRIPEVDGAGDVPIPIFPILLAPVVIIYLRKKLNQSSE